MIDTLEREPRAFAKRNGASLLHHELQSKRYGPSRSLGIVVRSGNGLG